jgi:hypothetical protein
MPTFSIRVAGARETAADLARMSTELRQGLVAATRRTGALLQTRVRANASGRPGPRAQTGDYRRSINMQMMRDESGNVSAVVGTNSAQGRRLEFGFWGKVDSLGRLFHQPPYPHFEPALEQTSGDFVAAIEQVVNGLG